MKWALEQFAPSVGLRLSLAAAVLAIASAAFAQTDLNRFVPRAQSVNSYEKEEFDEDAPPPPPARQRGMHHSERQEFDETEDVPSGYSTSAKRYRNPRSRPSESTAQRATRSNERVASRPSTREDSQRPTTNRRGMYEDSPLSRRPPTNNAHPDNAIDARSDSGEYGNMPASYQSSVSPRGQSRSMNSFGRSGIGAMNFGNFFGSMASRSVMQPTPSPANAPGVNAEPIVTPDAVYLDVEPVKVGKPVGRVMSAPNFSSSGAMIDGPMIVEGGTMPEERSFLPGGPIRGRTYDGYANPLCNDCCGGGCDNCGPRCGNNYGMYGGCEEGYDCCGGCGPNYGPFNGPYGRPWILAPLDFVFGGLWHTGPYWGACDPCGNWWWGQDFTVFGGVHDFRSPVNISGNSNFGFHEGVNWSLPLWQEFGIGMQVGFQATQNNLQSNSIDIFDQYRKQTFFTGGLFHRPCDGQGWQYGVVYDHLHDEFYQTFDVGQLRGELAWLWDCQNEIGFWFATGVNDSDNADDNVVLGATEFLPIDQYAFFYRRRFCRGGEGRLWGGFTGNNAGIVGADFRVPISKGWAVETGFNYLIADNDQNDQFSKESWNVGMNLVWYWGCNANCRSLYRPLFNVADNGTFMVTRSGLIGQ